MTDDRLRRLEREAKDDPAARERLEAEWLRAGLGWHGERLPEGLERQSFYPLQNERGVYGYAPWNSGDGGPIEMVYVPGGEAECYCPREFHDAPGFMHEPCLGTGRRKIAPFYLGRFPVTAGQFEASYQARFYSRAARSETYHPVVNVSHADALAFCSWAGLRLPSAAEWRWAALGKWGDPRECPDHMTGRFNPAECPQCVGRPCEGPRRYPKGASWCGAHDMAGNVWEWTSERSVLGGSFRTPLGNQRDWQSGLARALVLPADAAPTYLDNVRFRVALSAV